MGANAIESLNDQLRKIIKPVDTFLTIKSQ